MVVSLQPCSQEKCRPSCRTCGNSMAVSSGATILLHPPLPLVDVSIVMERERQQNDSLVNGCPSPTKTHSAFSWTQPRVFPKVSRISTKCWTSTEYGTGFRLASITPHACVVMGHDCGHGTRGHRTRNNTQMVVGWAAVPNCSLRLAPRCRQRKALSERHCQS